MLMLRHTNVLHFSSGVINASGVWYSDPIQLLLKGGNISGQWSVTGLGTCKIELWSSNDGKVFLNCNTALTTGQTVSTGINGLTLNEPGKTIFAAATNGYNMDSALVVPSGQLMVVITETGGANSVTVSFTLKGY
jgi:hypothetical protein